MKPSHTGLTCRAHNRFSPSIVLRQHFVVPNQPFHVQQRQVSTILETVQHDEDDAADSESQIAHGTRRLQIRRIPTDRGKWYAKLLDASIATNIRDRQDAREASRKATERLMVASKKAFEAAQDYRGVVVEPIVHPTPVDEDHLPWTLLLEERSAPGGRPLSGWNRLTVEIHRFCAYTTPGQYEALARRHVVEKLQNHVRQTLPHHVLETFGSERTGLAVSTSDIDLRLVKKEKLHDPVLETRPPTPKERGEAKRALTKLYHTDLLLSKDYRLVNLRHARYPLISLQDRQSGLDLQVVLANDTSLSREIMEGYMDQYPFLQQLYFVVKTMFDIRGLTDVFRGGFGSYTLFMMIVASLRHSPHARNDVAGGLINFIKFYRDFDTVGKGLSIEPVWMFDKSEQTVLQDKTKQKLEGIASPLPQYMLCLRDPADATNDLGRKAIAIRHVQTTFKKLCWTLERDIRLNTRPSLLASLVGPSYMLYRKRRQKLANYGKQVSEKMVQMGPVVAASMREENAEESESLDQPEEQEVKMTPQEKTRLLREEM